MIHFNLDGFWKWIKKVIGFQSGGKSYAVRKVVKKLRRKGFKLSLVNLRLPKLDPCELKGLPKNYHLYRRSHK